MQKNPQDIFHIAPPTGLDRRILARVAAYEARRRMWRIGSSLAASVVSVAALVLAGREAAVEITASGFGQYLSLAFTDGGAMLADWRDFAWTLAESAPVWGFAFCLGAAALVVGALRWTGRAFAGFTLGGANRTAGTFAL